MGCVVKVVDDWMLLERALVKFVNFMTYQPFIEKKGVPVFPALANELTEVVKIEIYDMSESDVVCKLTRMQHSHKCTTISSTHGCEFLIHRGQGKSS